MLLKLALLSRACKKSCPLPARGNLCDEGDQFVEECVPERVNQSRMQAERSKLF